MQWLECLGEAFHAVTDVGVGGGVGRIQVKIGLPRIEMVLRVVARDFCIHADVEVYQSTTMARHSQYTGAGIDTERVLRA